MQINQLIRTLVEADLSRPSTVTLSEAKGLSYCAERCFASLSMTEQCPTTVTLSEAKGLSHWAGRCIAALSMTEFPCHPERSEGSIALGVEMHR